MTNSIIAANETKFISISTFCTAEFNLQMQQNSD